MRTPIIAGNWKMNTTVTEAVKLVREMKIGLIQVKNLTKIICPPFVSLVPVKAELRDSDIKLGAQNVYFAAKGAFTGEISAGMLKEVCEYVILGHSERRQYFGETGKMISQKVAAILKADLKPILCVGENLSEYEQGQTAEVVSQQLSSSLEGIESGANLTIAYEPIWAIGTGKAATGEQANKTVALIRSVIARRFHVAVADNLRILYGGSVTAGNIAEFVAQPDIDGALVGGASLKPLEFLEIVQITSEIRGNKVG